MQRCIVETGIVEGVDSVSYTHLDVYKRQAMYIFATASERTYPRQCILGNAFYLFTIFEYLQSLI